MLSPESSIDQISLAVPYSQGTLPHLTRIFILSDLALAVPYSQGTLPHLQARELSSGRFLKWTLASLPKYGRHR
jgi:hypothetical protein